MIYIQSKLFDSFIFPLLSFVLSGTVIVSNAPFLIYIYTA